MTRPRPSVVGRDPDWARAEAVVAARLGEDGPAGARIVAFETREERPHPAGPTFRKVLVSVLAPAADIVVFFDGAGGLTGWRDDGRLGTAVKPAAPGPAEWEKIRAELGWPTAATPTAVSPAFLDPIGWTVEYRIRIPGPPTRTVRAWTNPDTHAVIQVLAPQGPAHGDDPLEQRARMAVLDLLRGRLDRAGIRAHPPHRFFVITVKAAEPFAGGTQFRTATWRHWSDAWAEFDGPADEPTGWRIDRLAYQTVTDPPAPSTIARLAGQLAPPPNGATRPVAAPIREHGQARAWRVSWEHDEAGIPVDGDRYRVDLHPVTRRLVGWERRWRSPTPNQTTPGLTPAQALDAAALVRRDRGFDPSLVAGTPRLCLVRPTDPPEPGDRIAWRVPAADGAGTVDVLIDAVTGRLLDLQGHR